MSEKQQNKSVSLCVGECVRNRKRICKCRCSVLGCSTNLVWVISAFMLFHNTAARTLHHKATRYRSPAPTPSTHLLITVTHAFLSPHLHHLSFLCTVCTLKLSKEKRWSVQHINTGKQMSKMQMLQQYSCDVWNRNTSCCESNFCKSYWELTPQKTNWVVVSNHRESSQDYFLCFSIKNELLSNKTHKNNSSN